MRIPTVLCFGDSNTWGCPPFTQPSQRAERLPPPQRWPRIAAERSGNAFEVIEEGLSGRTTVFDDPIEGKHKSGLRLIVPTLETHAPIDAIVLMLGTNDFKTQFGASSYTSARGLLTIIERIRGHYVLADRVPEILVVTPPSITNAAEPAIWDDAHLRCTDHAYYLDQVATRTGCFHLDANDFVAVGEDGVHIPPAAHPRLGSAIGERLATILSLIE